jgi:hypothetical protein
LNVEFWFPMLAEGSTLGISFLFCLESLWRRAVLIRHWRVMRDKEKTRWLCFVFGRALVIASKSFWIYGHCDFWMLRLSCFLQWGMRFWRTQCKIRRNIERPNNGKRGILDVFRVQHILIVYYSLALLDLIFDLHLFHLIQRITMQTL